MTNKNNYEEFFDSIVQKLESLNPEDKAARICELLFDEDEIEQEAESQEHDHHVSLEDELVEKLISTHHVFWDELAAQVGISKDELFDFRDHEFSLSEVQLDTMYELLHDESKLATFALLSAYEKELKGRLFELEDNSVNSIMKKLSIRTSDFYETDKLVNIVKLLQLPDLIRKEELREMEEYTRERQVTPVQLTNKQVEELKIFKNNGMTLENFLQDKEQGIDEYESLLVLSVDEMARLLLLPNSYKVRPIEVGDWVKLISWEQFSINKTEDGQRLRLTAQVTDVGGDNLIWCDEYIMRLKDITHATEEEIANEKKIQYWSNLGREVNEVRIGDKMIVVGGYILTVRDEKDIQSAQNKLFNESYHHFIPGECMLNAKEGLS